MSESHPTSMTLILQSERDTQRLAEYLATLQLAGSVWLSGDLGAGKTTLTRYWLRALGHTGAVKSPTYTLVEPYEISGKDSEGYLTTKPIYHVDLYRLQDPEELSFIGFDEYQQDPNALLIIEWPSRAEDYIAAPDLLITINQLGEGTEEGRQVELQVTEEGVDKGIYLSGLAQF